MRLLARLRQLKYCSTCNRSGYKDGYYGGNWMLCPRCHGWGVRPWAVPFRRVRMFFVKRMNRGDIPF